ncbi:hypothetical protein Si091_01930 [Streptococcus infantarius subsp. infantarius]|nr:hypothetical protein [Streptococcus infantarius subsp. infantarius]MCO4524523.1 hypothetical protein [Streptococcus infantarius subsp. infantarius]MCO4540091.1 hypothetical protein [Streptococcus infantarius subsp. infantarius]MCO4545880.1 hypothetical protein [Streptococcus infantarius subsp. infantarius]MCO4547753.1 hypothetical protein [Streptococcus infantarius subsp. infantarius]
MPVVIIIILLLIWLVLKYLGAKLNSREIDDKGK